MTAESTENPDLQTLRQREEKFHAFFEHDPEYCYMISPEGVILDINRAALDVLGYRREELVGQPISRIYAPEELPRVKALLAKWLQTGQLRNEELVIQTRKGERRTILLSVSAVKDAAGNLVHSISVQRDVTERKKTEEELKQTTARLKEAQRIAHIGSWELDLVDNTLTWSEEIFRIFEIDPEKFGAAYETFLETVHPEDRRSVDQAYADSVKTGKPYAIDHRLLFADGRIKYVHEQGKTFYDGAGRPLRSAGTVQDISERKLAEEKIARLAAIVASSGDAIIGKTLDGIITSWNRGAEKIYGYSEEEVIGKPVSLLLPSGSEDEVPRILRSIRAGKSIDHFETLRRRKDGSLIHVSLAVSPIHDAGGRIVAASTISRDITAHRKMEEALRDKEAFIRNILETVDEGFIVVDRHYRILSANRAFCRFVGLPAEQVAGRPCYEVSHYGAQPCFDAGIDCAVQRTFASGKPHTVSHTHGTGNDQHYVAVRSYPVRDAAGRIETVIATITDVTETRKLEEQLRHSQKLESLGTLAGGVAHDFNNILSVIVGYGELMQIKLERESPAAPYLGEILAAAKRAADLTRALLIFSRKEVAQLKPVDLNEIVSNMRKMLLRIIGEDIETTLHLAPEPLTVMGDNGQLEQILMNFATNARDAMPGGGSLRISTRLCTLDAAFTQQHGFGKPGSYALMAVEDTGRGMDAQTREKIFEPFFTTKKLGKGTGLGLSIAYGIVKQHNGYINCYSEPGQGTVFRVYLPLIDSSPPEAEADKKDIARGGNETILIADDDQNIRRVTRALLEEWGYTVLEAANGEEAVRIYDENRDLIRLVMLDAIMPKKSGREAFEEIRKMNPDARILFVSGYSEDVLELKKVIDREVPLLQKPVKWDELLAKIRELLDPAAQ